MLSWLIQEQTRLTLYNASLECNIIEEACDVLASAWMYLIDPSLYTAGRACFGSTVEKLELKMRALEEEDKTLTARKVMEGLAALKTLKNKPAIN